jgi:hypothetical protein
MSAPITRQHKNLQDALGAYRERHGSHPALDAAESHLNSSGGGYEQGRIGVDDRTPGQKSADRVREGSATSGKGEPSSPDTPEPHTTGQTGKQSSGQGPAASSGENRPASSAAPPGTGQGAGSGPQVDMSGTGQNERSGAVKDRSGQDTAFKSNATGSSTGQSIKARALKRLSVR